jgi:predicted ATPase
MRIAITGAACQGKSTLVDDFIKKWPNYKRSKESYRTVIKEENLKINKEADSNSQFKILNCLIDDLQTTEKTDKIIFDRCPLDNLVYSMWSFEKGCSDIDKEFIDKCIPLVRESMRHLDIIFFIPITKVSPVKTEEKKLRETDKTFIKETDNIFKAIHRSYFTGQSPFFPKDDSPAIIEIFGTPEERIKMIELYLNSEGNLHGEEESVLSKESLDYMETILQANKKAKDKEDEEIRLRKKFLFNK